MRFRQLAPLLAWLLGLLVGVVAFHRLGTGVLAPPALTQPDTWSAWAAQREPIEAVIALVRLVVLALAWYLVGVTTIGLIARLAEAARLVRVVDVLTVPSVRRLLQASLGLGLATAVVAAATPGLGPTAAPVVAVTVSEDADAVTAADTGEPMPLPDSGLDPSNAQPDGSSGSVQPVVDAEDPGVAGEEPEAPQPPPHPVVPEAPVAPDTPTGDTALPDHLASLGIGEEQGAAQPPGDAEVSPSEGQEQAPPQAMDQEVDGDDASQTERDLGGVDPGGVELGGVDPGLTTGPDEHVVVSGDSLWRIAEQALEASIGRSATDAEVVPYWQALIAANQDRLVYPEDPDLIFPGQRLVLPPIASPDDEGSAGAQHLQESNP